MSDGSVRPGRVCVVDLGTNSFHAVIAELVEGGTFRVIDKLKEAVLLAEGATQGSLTRDAVERAVSALRRIQLLAERRGVEEVVAYATSAIREADNGLEFVTHVKRELGVDIEPIPGEREARLIYRGVRRVVDLSETALLVDIGGGSTELVVADENDAHLARSLRLGAGRLTEEFVRSDPLDDDDRERLVAHLSDKLDGVVASAREAGVALLVGSSGTMETLAQLAFDDSDRDGRVDQHELDAAEVREACQRIARSSRKQRKKLGIAGHRIDQIGAGAVLLDWLIEAASIERVRISPAALREGMLDELLEARTVEQSRWGDVVDPLLRGAHRLALRHGADEAHASAVRRLALELFDRLEELHGLDADDRRLLEAAALVHDVGLAVAKRRHHKHSRYIIEQSRWPGVLPEKVAAVAAVARYHRRALPKKKHRELANLGKHGRRRVRRLGAMLRLANGLDRSHSGNVTDVAVDIGDDEVTITVAARRDPVLELAAGREAAEAFDHAFGRALRVHTAWQS